MLGSLVPINSPYEVISPARSSVQPASGGAVAGAARQMSPMESMKAIFEDIRDGIENIAGMVQTLVLGQQPTVGDKIAASDTDSGGIEDTGGQEGFSSGMLDSLKSAFADDGGIGKLKKALFAGIVASLFLFSDQIKAAIVPILKVGKQIYEFLGPKGSLILGLGAIAAFTFPKTFFTILKIAFKAIKFIPTIFSALSSGLSAVLVPLAPVIAIVAAIAAVIYSLKKGFDAFQESLDAGDSMIDAIIAGVSTALATLITLPSTLFKNLLSYVAGLFGFDGIKAKLDDLDFVEFFTNAFKMLFTGIKDFITGIFNIDFKGILGKGLDLFGAIATRIKAIAAAGFAALKAAFPGGESPGEAFNRVYQERMDKEDDSEPEAKGGPITISVDDAQSRMYRLQDQALMAGPDGSNQPEVAAEAKARALQMEKLLDEAYAKGKNTVSMPSGSIGKKQSDVEKLTDATAEKTHEEGTKRSDTKRDEYEGLKAQGFSKSDARLILMFDTNKTKGFPAYQEASMKALGYNFTPEFMTPEEKLAWMKRKMIVDDEGNLFKPTSADGDYRQLSQSEMRMRAASAEGRQDLNEAVAENKQAKNDSAGASGNIVVNNNSVDNSSQSQTNNTTKLSTDHSDPTANALKEVAGF